MTTSERRVQLQPGFVLHHRPYRNTSLLLDVFTRERGRLTLVARGARASRSRWQGQCQPFRPLLLSWTGLNDLASLTDLESVDRSYPLNGKVLFSGYYLNELLMRLLHPLDPHPDLYQQYTRTLTQLACLAQNGGTLEQSSRQLQSSLRLFEKYLLQELGYGLVLDHEAQSGAAIDPGRDYQYVLEIGPMPGDNRTAEAVTVSGRSLLALASDELNDPQCLHESKKLMRAALARYLGDRPLHTRTLLRQLEQLS